MLVLNFLVKEATQKTKACVIWMHGLGANSLDMANLVEQLPMDHSAIRHLFLDAPIRSVTINNGMQMRAWYDIFNLSTFTRREDKEGILQSVADIGQIIALQIEQGIAAERIVLAGFSQGGAMALYTGLQHNNLGGILALSCYLPLAFECQAHLNKATPIFLAYGKHDPIVLPEWSKMSIEWLSSSGFSNLTCYDYSMEHTICIEEINDISHWLTDLINGWVL